MKKNLGAAAVLLTVAALAGCGNSGTASETTAAESTASESTAAEGGSQTREKTTFIAVSYTHLPSKSFK